MNRAFAAMKYARKVHAKQKRVYTGNPYADHLAEVAGIMATVAPNLRTVTAADVASVCWLKDTVRYQGVELTTLVSMFGETVAGGVYLLTDLETGSLADRLRLKRERLATSPGWVQSIKVAEMLSNTVSVVRHDRSFAGSYLPRKLEMLAVLKGAHKDLWHETRRQIEQGIKLLEAFKEAA